MEGEVSYVLMDLADLDTVKVAVERILGISKTIDYVILNAGLLVPTLTKTKHDMELTIGATRAGVGGLSACSGQRACMLACCHCLGVTGASDAVW